MGFGEAIRTCFSKYATFAGRAPRSEYWWFTLFTSIVATLALIPVFAAGGPEQVAPWMLAPVGIVLLAMFLPGPAVSVRRLHDSNRSGWWYLINLVPYVGGLVFLVFMLLPGTDGENRFGPRPG